MQRLNLLATTLLLGALTGAGCAGNGNLPDHNHPEGAAVSSDRAPNGAAESPDAKLELWRLSVAGAT
jgi:hypothetical protein